MMAVQEDRGQRTDIPDPAKKSFRARLAKFWSLQFQQQPFDLTWRVTALLAADAINPR
jgi:hypothetical protein